MPTGTFDVKMPLLRSLTFAPAMIGPTAWQYNLSCHAATLCRRQHYNLYIEPMIPTGA
jgi:hypothetical protein